MPVAMPFFAHKEFIYKDLTYKEFSHKQVADENFNCKSHHTTFYSYISSKRNINRQTR